MAGLSASYAFAQTRSISGTVVDSQNVPVIGASVIVVGNNTMGTVTDLDGKFTLNV
ncbi:MAG: carboxypeptidase-like regulatory domain-containing protein, partial [Bacteroidales bacterium]|nr:carboxypeptidase-like regulatory domain-containing protein [Bacteroidales bacterium]